MSDETDKATATELENPEAADISRPEEVNLAEGSPEELEELREKAAKGQEHWDRLVRVSADFDNYRKRATRERQEAIRFANESLLEKLIPLLDNLEMALAAADNAPGADKAEALKAGVSMIYNQLRAVLADAGVEEIDAAGKPFDPNWHEAVAQQVSTEMPEGTVLQQLRKGFKLKERLIRPATVVVAKQPAA
jgi:molecular chaperone GrpE